MSEKLPTLAEAMAEIDGRREMMICNEDDKPVVITDGDGRVKIWAGGDFSVSMTPEQARFIAKHLMESAKRIEKALA